MMKLALRLGKTLAELNATLSLEEFYYWVAFDRISPIGDERKDIHSAQIASAVYQAQGAKVGLKECLLEFNKTQKAPEQEQDIGDALAMLIGRKRGK